MRGSNGQRLVLVAHVDGTLAENISQILEARQHRVLTAGCAAEGLKYCAEESPDLILLDAFLPLTATRGIPAEHTKAATELLRTVRRANSGLPVLALIHSQVSLSTCCQCVLEGFNGFLDTSAVSLEHDIVEKVAHSLLRYQQSNQDQASSPPWELLKKDGVVGVSPVWRKLLSQLWRTSLISDVPVLIQGQSGTGKQVLAEAIHRLDPKRKNKRFATVNCAAITGTLAESELFGHCKGAFTGATSDRLGHFRSCDGGTLFLDEISELDMNLQPKLLRVLQEGKVLPVGSDTEYAVDVRVITSSNKPLHQLGADDEFRLDLYQRLKVVSLQVPPLRDRLEDIPLLVRAFLDRYSHYYNGTIESVDPQVFDILNRARLPGNVRELENIIRQALVMKVCGSRLEITDLPDELIAQAAEVPDSRDDFLPAEIVGSLGNMLIDGHSSLPELVEFFEKTLINQTLGTWNSTQSELAQRLGLTRRTFYNKLQKYSIGPAGLS